MAYTNIVEKDFKYTTLVGLGSAALKQDEGLAELQVILFCVAQLILCIFV